MAAHRRRDLCSALASHGSRRALRASPNTYSRPASSHQRRMSSRQNPASPRTRIRVPGQRRRRLEPGRLAFVDETWIKTNMAPRRGWAPKGRRLKGFAPHGRWRTLTFLAGLRHDGLSAPCVFDGPIDGRSFQAWVEQHLIPTLRPGDIVILDNLASHKGKGVRQAIRKAGARLWLLPAYSPDLNPIEQTFAKIKHWMRDARKRTVEDIWRHLGDLLGTIEPHECQELQPQCRVWVHVKRTCSSETCARPGI